MTAHELARALLEMPDVEVSIWKYRGDGDELLEIEDLTISIEPYPYVVLHTYKQ